MGIVYHALDRETGREVALKTLREREPSTLLRLKHEFRSLAGLRHPNLVALYDLVAADDHWFFTMELIDGTDVMRYVSGQPVAAPAPTIKDTLVSLETEPFTDLLHEQLVSTLSPFSEPARARSRHRVDFEVVRDVIRQLACGVSALHSYGVLHQDLKPSNVLVATSGRLAILDFGIAVELAAPRWNERGREWIGTPSYMAPEQVTLREPSEAGDWYAVGVILYQLLTGVLPFTGPRANILSQKQLAPPPPPRVHNLDIPEDLSALCHELLQREPERRPRGPAVLARVGATTASVHTTRRRGEYRRLVARTEQQAILRSAMEEVEAGRAATVLVGGRSGMGKTALVHHFLEEVRDGSNVLVLAGRCYERESVPYKAVDAVIDSLCRYLLGLPHSAATALVPHDAHALVRMFPVLRRVDAIAAAHDTMDASVQAHEIRRRGVAALRELLGRLARRQPLIVFIDDLHWGDLDSAPLLVGLLRAPDPPPLLLVATYRVEDATSPFLQALLAGLSGGAADVRRVEVGQLPLDEATELVHDLLADGGPVDSEMVAAIAHEAGGHPFFIHELCRLATTNPGAAVSRRGLGLDALIRAEMEGLPELARRLMEVIAVAGEPIQIEIAAMAAGVNSHDDALERIRAAQLVRRTVGGEAPRLESYHDRVREALVNRLEPELHRQYHRALATAYEASPSPDAETLSVHYAAAGDAWKAGSYAETAADQAAAALAHAHAVRLYELALGLMPAMVRGRLLEKLASALVNAGRGADAAARYVELSRYTSGARALDFRRLAAEQLLRSGYVERGLDELRGVLAGISLGLPASPLATVPSLLVKRFALRLRGVRFQRRLATSIPSARLMELDICWSAAIGLSLFDPVRGAVFATRALLLALKAGEPRRLAMALAMQAGHLESAGSTARAEDLLRRAQELAADDPDPRSRGFIAAIRAIAMNERAEFSASLALCAEAEAILRGRCAGVAWELRIVELFRMTNLYYLGRLREIGDVLPGMMADNRERGDRFAAMNLETLFLPFLLLLRGDPDEARRCVDAVDRWAPDRFYLQHLFALEVRTMADLTAGDAERAYRRILDTERALARSLLLRDRSIGDFWRHLRATTTIAAAIANPGERAPRLRAARAAGRRLVRSSPPAFAAAGRLVLHGVALLEGRPDRALGFARDALAGFEATGLRFHEACARWRLGAILGGDEGAALVASARACLRSEGVVDADGLLRVYSGVSP